MHLTPAGRSWLAQVVGHAPKRIARPGESHRYLCQQPSLLTRFDTREQCWKNEFAGRREDAADLHR